MASVAAPAKAGIRRVSTQTRQLGYAGGGLPIALIAAMLLRSWRVNLCAAGISALLVAVGFILVAYRSPGQPSALRLYFQ